MSGPIYVAGHRGMVGSAIVRALLASGIPSQQILTKTRAELDLTRQAAVEDFLEATRPEQVYLAALYNEEFRQFVSEISNPYGEGNSAEKIIEVIKKVPLNDELIQKKIL